MHVALFFHLVGAFLFVSGSVVAAVALEAARRRDDVAEIALVLTLARVAVALVGVGAALLIAFGLWLAEETGGFRPWVDAALALFAATAVLGALGGRRPRRARVLAAAGGPLADVRRLLDDPWSRVANYAAGALVTAILVLMVWQP